MKTLHSPMLFLFFVHTITGQGFFDMFGGFGPNTGGMAGMTGGGLGSPPVNQGSVGPDPTAADARLTMAEEQMAEVMGESPKNSAERKRIDRLLKATGGKFSGDAAPLNYLVSEYHLTTPGTVPPPMPKRKGGRRGGGKKQKSRAGKRRSRKRQGIQRMQGGRPNNYDNRRFMPGGAGLQPPQPDPTAALGKMGRGGQFGAPQRHMAAQMTGGRTRQRAGKQMSKQQGQRRMYRPQPPMHLKQVQRNQAQPYQNKMQGQLYPAQPSSKQMNTIQGPRYQQQPPSNKNQGMNHGIQQASNYLQPTGKISGKQSQIMPPAIRGHMYQTQPSSKQTLGQLYKIQPPTDINIGIKQVKHQTPTRLPPTASSMTKKGGVAANRLRGIQGRIDSANNDLLQAQQTNHIAEIQAIQLQLEALNGVKSILTGGSAGGSKMQPILGKIKRIMSQQRTSLPTQAPTKRSYGPPQFTKANNAKRTSMPINYNNFQETNIGGGNFAQTWEYKTPAPLKQTSQRGHQPPNLGPPSSQKGPPKRHIQLFEGIASTAGSTASTYDQGMTQQTAPHSQDVSHQTGLKNQGTNQQFPPYAQMAAQSSQGMKQQVQSYSPIAAQNNQGKNKQTQPYSPQYNQGMNRQNNMATQHKQHARQQTQSYNQQNQGMGQQPQSYDQHNQGMGQQTQPLDQYNQGMGQQTQPFDQYNQGMGQNPRPNDQYNQGMGQQPQSYNQQNEGMGQQPQPYNQQNQGMSQQPQPFDQYNQGMGQNPQHHDQYNQGMGQQPQSYNQQNQGMGQQPQPYNQQNQGMGQQPQPYDQQNQGLGQNPQPFDQYNQGMGNQPQPFDQYNQGMGQQPYDQYNQGMGQQQQPYDQHNQGMGQQPQPYNQQNQGMGQQPYDQYNQGMGQQQQPFNQGMDPAMNQQGPAKPTPMNTAQPASGPAEPATPAKLGDIRWTGNVEYIYTDADGFDTFQWIKKSTIPAGQLDHLPQNKEKQGKKGAGKAKGKTQAAA